MPFWWQAWMARASVSTSSAACGGDCGVALIFRSRLGIYEFHGEKRHAVMFPHFKDLHDVRMLEACDGLRFSFEPCQRIRPSVAAGQYHLQRHDAIQTDLASLV